MNHFKLSEGDHVQWLVRWTSDGQRRYTKFTWKVIAIDSDDPNNIRIENCHGGRKITTRDRVRPARHHNWVALSEGDDNG